MNIEKPTFKHICLMHMQQLTNFPYIEKDFDALTDYALLCKVVDYLNEVIANNNLQNDSITNLYNAFIELKNYIDNYFANLDVQDEINNKLDEMAEDGSLISLIASYLPFVTPEMYGAIGDGITDDTIAFQQAINSLKPVKANNSYLLKDIELKDGSNIEFSPNSIITRNKTDSVNNAGLFVARGTLEDNARAIIEETTERNYKIKLNSVTGLNKGDLLLIKNNAESDADSNKMIVTTITSISSNEITLSDNLQWIYPVNSVVYKINPISFKINGNGCKYNNNGLIGRGYFINAQYVKDSIIENVNIDNSPLGILRIEMSYNTIIKNCSGKNPTSNTAPYGEFLSILYSNNVNCYNILGVNYRRCVDFVGSVYCNCYDSKGVSSAFTTHGLLARYCSFINCTFEQNLGAITPSCVIGNLDYYYDLDITFKNCIFNNGNRNIYVVNNECTCTIDNCEFLNSNTCIYNNGLNVNINNSVFSNIITLISNTNTEVDNIVNISNCNAITRGSSSTSVFVLNDNVLNTLNIYNSSFKGSNKMGTSKFNLYDVSMDFETASTITLLSGSRMYNSINKRTTGIRDDIKIYNSCINSVTHNDATNAQNVIIEGCLYAGTINVSNNQSVGNYIDNNIAIQSLA